MIMHLGVIDIPYATPPSASKGRKKAAAPKVMTTGDVAEVLENKYHIMEIFFEDVGHDLIANAIAHSYSNAIENLVMGAPVGLSPTAEATTEIEAAFKLFLSQKELDGLQPGVPTEASLRGVSHRFEHPYAKRPSRPSFIDTGLYQSSFHVWFD